MIIYNKKDGINQVHDYSRRVKRYLEELKNIDTENSKKIIEFHRELTLNGLAVATQVKYLDKLSNILDWVDKEFDSLSKEDIINFMDEHITNNPSFGETTKIMHRIIFKRFFQWIKGYGNKEYPSEVSWIRGNTHNKQRHKNPEDMLNDEDIEKMVKIAEHPRDKAFIITLAESGCRIGEILTLTTKNICFDNRGAYFLVDGKTGTRRVRVVNSTPYLHAWLNIHPERDKKESPLWTNIGNMRNISKKIDKLKNYKLGWRYNMTYAAARNLLIKTAKRAEIGKPINPHNFRHSRATSLGAAGISGVIMNEVMGWVQGSRVSATYLHISGKQVDDILLPTMYGMKVQKIESSQPKMFPIKCMSCGELNEYNSQRCKKCNSIIGTLTKDDLEENSAVLKMSKMLKNLMGNDEDIRVKFVEQIKKEIMEEIKHN